MRAECRFIATFVINIILCLTFPVSQKHRPLSLGPEDPALLSAALNINTCLRGPVNTRYRGEALKERTKHCISPMCMKMESGAGEERRRNGKET